jgi:hypothetical protein
MTTALLADTSAVGAIFIIKRKTRTQNVLIVIIPCKENGCARQPAGGQAKGSSPKRGLRLLGYNKLYLRQCAGVRTPCRKDELCYE